MKIGNLEQRVDSMSHSFRFGLLLFVSSLVAAGVSYFVSLSSAPPSKDISGYVLRESELIRAERRWVSTYVILVIYFILMLTFLLLL